MSSAAKVELHPAHEWDCPECGVANFARCIVWEGSEEDLQWMREEHGLEPWEVHGQFVTAPEKVTCSECGREFDTVDYRQEPDDDD